MHIARLAARISSGKCDLQPTEMMITNGDLIPEA